MPFKIFGNWEAQSKKLKEEYVQLTQEDLRFETGKENELIERMIKRLNKKRDEVITMLLA